MWIDFRLKVLHLNIMEKCIFNGDNGLTPKQFEKQPMGWISDHTTGNLRTWIPEMKDRSGDLHVMLPICFEHHVTELRKHDSAFPMPKVDNLYLLLIWAECFGLGQAPLSARVLRDLLACLEDERLQRLECPNPANDVLRRIPILSRNPLGVEGFLLFLRGNVNGKIFLKPFQKNR